MKRDQLTQLSAEIIKYLDLHPGAVDSMEGIAKWWLLDTSQVSMETLAYAIKHLVDEGVLAEVKTNSNVILYKSRSAV